MNVYVAETIGAPRNQVPIWALDTDWWHCSGAQRELLEPEAPRSGRDGPKRAASSWSSWSFLYFPMAVCQNLVPLVNIKIAGKWMFIPLKMVLIGIDPYSYHYASLCFTVTSTQQSSAPIGAGIFSAKQIADGHERNVGRAILLGTNVPTASEVICIGFVAVPRIPKYVIAIR